MSGFNLPDISTRVVVDDSQLKNVGATGAKTGAQLEAGMAKGTGSLSKLSTALSSVMGVSGIGGMPLVALKGEQALTGLTTTGVSGMGLLAGGALVAVGAVAAVLKGSVDGYVALGNQVENYRRVTGSSAQESGAMVQTFTALGVGADTATAGMFKLSKAIETTPAKFTALGVVVAKDASGNVDLSKTLMNVADAYNATLDPAKKNLILFDAFGRSGKDMIPVLEQGSAALTKLEASAALTFTDADLQKLKDYQIQQAQLKQGWDAIWQSIGQKVVPALNDLITNTERDAYVQDQLSKAVDAGTISYDESGAAQGPLSDKAQALADKFGAQFDASKKAAGALDAMTQAAQDAAAAQDALWTAADKVVTQEEAQVNAGFALTLANLDVRESAAKVAAAHAAAAAAANTATKAHEALTAAIKKFGPGSEQARMAADALAKANIAARLAADDQTRAQVAQEKAYMDAAEAARKLQHDTDVATGAQDGATLETQAYLDKLQAEANSLAPNSPLRQYLQGYIDKLNSTPEIIATQIVAKYSTTGSGPGGHGVQKFAGGGETPVGEQFLVGEQGPELLTLNQPATVTPHGAAPPASSPLAGAALTINVPRAPAAPAAPAALAAPAAPAAPASKVTVQIAGSALTAAQGTAEDLAITRDEAKVRSRISLVSANLAVHDSTLKISQAQAASVAAADNVTRAHIALEAAIKKYGATSTQAKFAADALTRAHVNQRAAAAAASKVVTDQTLTFYDAADAARQYQTDLDLATTGTQNVALETKAYIDTLQSEANALAKGAVRTNLQAYIDQLKKDIAKTAMTTSTAPALEASTWSRDAAGLAALQGFGGALAAPAPPTIPIMPAPPNLGPPGPLSGFGGGGVNPLPPAPPPPPSFSGGKVDPETLRLLQSIADSGLLAAEHLASLSGAPSLNATSASRRQG